MPPTPTPPDWPGPLRHAYAIHNVTAMRGDLPFFLIRWDGERALHWMDLTDPRQRLRPFHFEIYFGKKALRDAHYHAALTEARRGGAVVRRELFGFWDLFYPLPADRGPNLFLYAGPFCRAQPDWPTLSAQWRALTGQSPAAANPDFVRFVRMALSLPVLEPPLLEAIEQFAVLYGEHLLGAASITDLDERIERLNSRRISRLWPIEDWVESAISPDKFHLTPWQLHGGLTEWMMEGMGIDRLPTVAMALMPIDGNEPPLDPVQTLVRNAQVQRACIELARDLPETAATRLQDYGVSIITSTAAGQSAAQQRAELRERAQRFRDSLASRFGLDAVVGVGTVSAPGSPLHASHRAAVLALHRCVELRRDVLFHDEDGAGEPLRFAELHAATTALLEALDREHSTEVELATDRCVRLVLRFSSERIEVARGQLLALLFQILGANQRNYPMAPAARDQLARDLSNELEEACSLRQVVEGFTHALGRLSYLSAKAWDGPSVMRLETTLAYLRDNYGEHLTLPAVARRAGFSVAAFSRVFKRATGSSFLAYLRAIRVERAKHLLATTPLDTDRIATACGFQSPHQLLRSFKQVTRSTPSAYRRASRVLGGDHQVRRIDHVQI